MTQPTSAEPQVAAPAPHPGQEHGHGKGGLLGLVVGSIGVVYGDIGTSPLYALREAFLAASGGHEGIERDDLSNGVRFLEVRSKSS